MTEAAEPQREDFLAGVPIAVDPAAIDHELSRLWKPSSASEGGETHVTRACLANVIFDALDEGSRRRMEKVLPALGKRMPSRTIILLSDDAPPKKSDAGVLRASITAVCHLVSPGVPPVCCEQITLAAPPQRADLIPGAVAPLLVPDVPVCFAAARDGGEHVLDLLDEILDKVVFDSRDLPLDALRRPLAVLNQKNPCAVDDLAWRETVEWRRIICEVFDNPNARAFLPELVEVEVGHQAGGASRAGLLAGWVASRSGRELKVVLRETRETGPAPGEILWARLSTGPGGRGPSLVVRRTDRNRVLRIEYHGERACILPRLIPIREEGDAELLGGAFERTTHQGVLRASLEAACKLTPTAR